MISATTRLTKLERESMKLGLFSMPLHPPGRVHAETYEEDLALLRLADGLGFSEAWIGEHFTLPWENIPAPDIFIARALGETEQMVLGTGVVLLHYHNPVMVAHRIAMLDHLAKGRFAFGIGSGGSPEESGVFGIEPGSGAPRDRMRESIDLILKLWTEDEPFEYKGKYFNSTVYAPMADRKMWFHMKPYQKPHPPIAVAGSSPRSETLETAGEMGWWPMSSALVHRSSLAGHWNMVEKGAAKTGKTPSRRDWRIAREMYVAESSQQAREDALSGPLGKFFTDYWMYLIGNGPRGTAAFKIDPEMPDEELTPEYMLENFWIVGDPDECTQKIRDLYDQVGGFGVLLPQTHDWGRDQSKWNRSMELMAKEVLPGLQDLEP